MWVASLKDWEKVPVELYRIIATESEKRVSDLLDDSEKITTRTYTIFGFLITGLTISAGYIFKNIHSLTQIAFIDYCALISLAPIIQCLFLLLSNLTIRTINRLGTEPKIITTSAYLENTNLDDIKQEKEKCLLLFLIEQNQEKIIQTEEENRLRMRRFENVLLLLFFYLLFFIVVIISNLLLSH